MKYYYDFEFIERGHGYPIEPISVGMVNDLGEEYYAVYNDFNTFAVAKHDWLMNNVMTNIPHTTHLDWEGVGYGPVKNLTLLPEANAKSREQIAQELSEFIQVPRKNFSENELFGWYSSYDHVCLATTFGTMMDLPKHVPMFTNDIKTLVKLAGNPQMPRQPEGLHNALEDAKWTKVRYDFITDYIKFRDQ